VRILLPPSEGKSSGGDGPPLAELGFGPGPVGRHRTRLCASVERTATRARRTAVAAFALPEAVADAAIAANAIVTASPTRAALDRYTGVVFDGLRAATMTDAERVAADEHVLVFSGLFGVLGGSDLVPEYRVPAASVLPRIGLVGASWRPLLSATLPARLGGGLVVDLRSSDYAAMWRAPKCMDIVSVRILTEMPDGRLMVVSYVSKLAKGRLARALVDRAAAGEPAARTADVVRAWVESGLGLPAPWTSTTTGRLELITAPAG
jgi:cytoplasmic iron level regulating protein YaaA (DUF328/UPF0246 family)